jgi:hypothetical protein
MKYLLAVGVLLLASVASLYAEPAATQPVSWFGPVGAGTSAPRSGFLLPTLAGTATGAAPRLIVTENAFRGAVPVRLTPAAGQTQAPAKPSKSWWSRNWLWVVVPVAILAGLAIAACTGMDAQCN